MASVRTLKRTLATLALTQLGWLVYVIHRTTTAKAAEPHSASPSLQLGACAAWNRQEGHLGQCQWGGGTGKSKLGGEYATDWKSIARITPYSGLLRGADGAALWLSAALETCHTAMSCARLIPQKKTPALKLK